MARALAVVAVMAMAMFGMASAATYNVGEPGGSWDLRTNYTDWVTSKRFHPGDQLVFKYPVGQHDVVEVTKEAFDSCTAANAIATHTNGNDIIPLTAPGTRYFLCSIGTHCANGMKIQVDVVSGATSMAPTPAGAPGSSPSTPSTPSTPGSSASTIKGTAAGFGLAAVMLAAGLMA
ncbi:hypothetical protein PR202_gb29726 [Eleusine coracana subsp. coracana]|uniref:Phytocyanin domain-containing protein n=1 Tax=Eleusine coracana subsp. coracana TaxID=191504 RepID=A0AAV5G0S1_ELECO|nr:hypothetical protein QOZ80_6BG0478500 [Eleusine coracana subsp. coracana]GJN40505.1 hypothetical protein PR202_gb29726 [Eleusine coracana subsp. coracana]